MWLNTSAGACCSYRFIWVVPPGSGCEVTTLIWTTLLRLRRMALLSYNKGGPNAGAHEGAFRMIWQNRWAVFCIILGFIAAPWPTAAQTRVEFEQWRHQLVDKILVPAGITDPRVVDAMKTTPRHEFVPLPERAKSYYDMGLPIGNGQTISSPLIVSQMTQALKPL